MAPSYGKKPGIKAKFNAGAEKVKSGIKKLFVGAAMLGAVGAAGYYPYGTMQEQEVKVTRKQDNTGMRWDYKTGDWQSAGDNCVVTTNKGIFMIAKSRLHLQDLQDVENICDSMKTGKTYRLETYGWHLAGGWQPNILAAHEITKEELEARQAEMEALKEAEKQEQQAETAAAASAGEQPSGVIQQAPAVASGVTVTYVTVVDGYNVSLTVPAEAASSVKVNSVKPLVPVFQSAPKPAASPSPGH